MRKRVFGKRLGRDTNERKALFRSLAVAIFTHGRIDTTVAKAKAVRPMVEKLVTTAKVGDLNSRRLIFSRVPNADIVEKLITQVGPTFAARPGGYTRLIKLGSRLGDNAPMARLEFVEQFKEAPPRKPGKFQTKNIASKTSKKLAATKNEEASKTSIKKSPSSKDASSKIKDSGNK